MSAIDITKVRTTKAGYRVRDLCFTSYAGNPIIEGEVFSPGFETWQRLSWGMDGSQAESRFDLIESPVAATVPHAPFGPGGPAAHCTKPVAAEPAAPPLPTGISIHTDKPVAPLAYPLRADRHVVIDQRGRWVFGWLHFATSEQEAERLVADMNEAERRRAIATEPAALTREDIAANMRRLRAEGSAGGGPENYITEPQPQKPKAITRYEMKDDGRGYYPDYRMRPDTEGDYVLYADHIAAMAGQDKDFSEAMIISHMHGALDSERKYREEIKELRAKVAALTHRDADVGREELGPAIFAASDGAPGAWSIADALLAKYKVTLTLKETT